jgi:hypothetical protein
MGGPRTRIRPQLADARDVLQRGVQRCAAEQRAHALAMAEAMAAADAHAAARLSELSARTADAAAIAEHARQATPPHMHRMRLSGAAPSPAGKSGASYPARHGYALVAPTTAGKPTQEAALLTLRIDGIAMDHRRSAEALAAELRARGREEPPALAAVAARCTRLEDAQAAMQVSLQSGARTSVDARGRRRLVSRRIRPLRFRYLCLRYLCLRYRCVERSLTGLQRARARHSPRSARCCATPSVAPTARSRSCVRGASTMWSGRACSCKGCR